MWKLLSVAAFSVALLPSVSTAASPADLKAGEKLYKTACFACHGTGVANAPKLGDKKAWAPIIERGMEEMMQVTLKGRGAMPPRGGTRANDESLKKAVEYMLSTVQ